MTVEAAAINDPNNPIVQIDRALFARIEDQQTRVSETARHLVNAAEEHKECKKAHEAALSTLTGLVAAMVRKVNGQPSDLPLFDNMSEAVESANADPIVQKLLTRMLDHGLNHVNALIVAGYDEAQRNELSEYLDSMDARKVALAQPEGFEPVPEVIVPDFLKPQEPDEITEQQIIEALAASSVVMRKKHIRLMESGQRAEVLAYAAEVTRIRETLGEAVTMDDLPAAPSFVINPKELEPKPDTDEVVDTGDTSDRDETSQAVAPKVARAPRRSSSKFKNTPRVAKSKAAKRR